jgi:ATP adenylyltransferase
MIHQGSNSLLFDRLSGYSDTWRRSDLVPETSVNLWAPWRMEYIRAAVEEGQDDGCFLCRYWSEPDRDAANHVLWRTDHTFVLLNRFPYTGGHVMVALAEHKGDLTELSDAQLAAMNRGICDAVRVLRAAAKPQGFNIGYNLGRCAGAGLPEHLHAHVVPRWAGDTNFMSVVGDARVIPEALEDTYGQLLRSAQELGVGT